MAGNKTTKTDASVEAFLTTIDHKTRRSDADKLLEIMKKVTGLDPRMWGPSLIGFDQYHYKYDSGREGDFFKVGFSPRKANLAIYIMPGFEPYADKLAKLGKHKIGASCLYINKLADVDLDVLSEIVEQSYKDMQAKYPSES